MGMYDELVIDGVCYQTKSLDSSMDTYYIKDGKLVLEIVEKEWVPDSTSFLGGFLSDIPNTRKDVVIEQFHGDIIFYNHDETYMVRFTHGIVENYYKASTPQYYDTPLYKRYPIWKKITRPGSTERTENEDEG